MADGRHVRKKIGNAITRLPMDRLGWNLVGRIQPQHLHRKTVSLVLVITAIPHSEHNGFMGFIDQKYPQTKNTFCRTRSLSNATFSLLITWRSSSSKSAAVYKISSKSDDFSLRCGDISIFKMAAVHRLEIVLPPYETTYRSLCCCCLSNFMPICLFGLKCLLGPLQWGVGGL